MERVEATANHVTPEERSPNNVVKVTSDSVVNRTSTAAGKR